MRGREDLLTDPRFDAQAKRPEHVNELEGKIERTLVTKATDPRVTKLDAAGVPAGPIVTYDQTLENEHVRARDMVAQLKHRQAGTMNILGPAAELSDTPATLREPVPMLRQHTTDALQSLVMDEASIEDLYHRGFVHDVSRPEATHEKEQA